MTSRKQLKARVRARMARTGESYTTALRHVTGAGREDAATDARSRSWRCPWTCPGSPGCGS